MIPVTKPYLPNREKLNAYIDDIFSRQWLTNNGPLVEELTQRLESYLNVENLLLVSNGTLALQVAYKTLGISQNEPSNTAEAITTPFTYIATSSSLDWEGIEPIFADIRHDTWCLDPDQIRDYITSKTRAIVPVHVFGNSCDVERIDAIASENNLKVIYDAAHAFGVKLRGRSILTYGDASTLSFHATKLFHTIEGGAIIFKKREDLEVAKRMINFGISSSGRIEEVGINAKMNEFQAAMGLCVLDEFSANLESRERIWKRYEAEIPSCVQLQVRKEGVDYNFAYFPIVLENEDKVLTLLNCLQEHGVYARRYFYPSLNSVERFGSPGQQPIAESISKRILCLPIYASLESDEQQLILNIIHSTL